MKIKNLLTALLLIVSAISANAQDFSAETDAKADSIDARCKLEIVNLRADFDIYLAKISPLRDDVLISYVSITGTLFPFLKVRVKTVEELRRLCEDKSYQSYCFDFAKKIIEDYQRQKKSELYLKELNK